MDTLWRRLSGAVWEWAIAEQATGHRRAYMGPARSAIPWPNSQQFLRTATWYPGRSLDCGGHQWGQGEAPLDPWDHTETGQHPQTTRYDRLIDAGHRGCAGLTVGLCQPASQPGSHLTGRPDSRGPHCTCRTTGKALANLANSDMVYMYG